MPTAFLVVSVIGLLFTLNAWRPLRVEMLSVFTFFAGWLTSELPLHHIAWQVLATAAFVAAGALDGWQGWVGLGICVVSWIGLVVVARRARFSGLVVEKALRDDMGLSAVAGPAFGRLALPFYLRDREVEVIKDVAYVEGGGRRQRLDIYRPRQGAEGAPVLFYIHGGGWVIGDKREQGRPLMLHLSRRGWVCVAVNYRLSPKVAFPEHLVDCQTALAWTKEHIGEWGGDPTRIVVSGNSAGGHLTALVSLTPGADVRAAVPFYGIYDFANREGFRGWGFGRFLERTVMQASLAAAPDLYRQASPLDQIHADAPPFMIVHGRNDTLAPVEEARAFARALRDVSRAPVVYVELPGTQHAFEVFRSIRAAEVIPRVEVFLDAVLATSRQT